MRRHLGKARYAAILIVAAVAVVLFARAYTGQVTPAGAAMTPIVPGPAELELALRRAELEPEAVAAAGVSSGAAGGVVTEALSQLVATPGVLDAAAAALAEARQLRDQLERVIQAGHATPEQLSAYPLAVSEVTQFQSQLQTAIGNLSDQATAALSTTQRATLATIRSNRRWDLPTEFLVINRPEAQWVELRNCLANERIAAALGEDPDPQAQAALAAFRSNPLVAAAKANLDANLAVVTAAWQAALGL